MAKTTQAFTITVPKSVHAAIEKKAKQAGKGQFSRTACELLASALNMSTEGAPKSKQEAAARISEGLTAFFENPNADEIVSALQSPRIFADPDLACCVPTFLLGAASRSEWFTAADQNPIVHVVTVPYSIGLIQARLERQIFDWIAAALPPTVRYETVSVEHGVFDAVINVEFAMGIKTLYLFPFYCTHFRRALFGVIPYGSHIAVGIMLPRASPLVTRLKEAGIDLHSAATISALVRSDGSGGRLRFFKEMFLHLIAGGHEGNPPQQKVLVLQDNWLHREMLPLLKGNMPHGLPLQSFTQRNFVELATSGNNFGATVLTDNKQAILLYDLSTEQQLKKRVKPDDFFFLRIRHGQDVPVGIGFTLNALPFMAEVMGTAPGVTIAATLREAVKEITKSYKGCLAREFLGHGVLLNPAFRYKNGSGLPLAEEDLVQQVLTAS